MLQAFASTIYMVIFIAFVVVNSILDRHQKGYVWRIVKRIPPWRNMAYPVPGGLLLVGVLFTLEISIHLAGASWTTASTLYWLSLIGIELDDFLNGDEDKRRRRREWVKNKVKWLKTRPAMKARWET